MMRPRANLLRLRNVPIIQALRLEEALFRVDKARSWLITNEWDPQGGVSTLTGEMEPASAAIAVVLGISGKPAELVHLDRAEAAGVPLCKRFTGGGTVIVDTSTIFVTFIAAEGALPHVKPYPEPVLKWTSDVYADALGRCGVDGFATHANDYCIDDRKFGGNAQSISGGRWLHHTSILWDYDPARMALLQMPAKRPEYRADRAHDSFLRSLSAAGLRDRSALIEASVGATSEHFDLDEVSIVETREASATPHRKVTVEVPYDVSV